MSRRWLAIGVAVLVVAGVAAVVVALTGSSREGPAPSEGESEPPVAAGVYAYMKIEFGQNLLDTQGEMVVMDGAEQIGSAPFSALGTRPVFTDDGQYAYTLLFGDELSVVSAETGEVVSAPCEGCSDRQLECQCQTVVPFGDSRIAWLDDDHHVVHMDLAAESPEPQQTDTTLPTEDGFLDEQVSPNLIAGTDGAALAAYPGGLPGDDLMPAYLVTLDDEPRRLDSDRPDSVEEAVFSPDGSHVALTGNQERACATVTVVDVASGEGETAPVSAEPGTECDDHDVYIDGLWWDLDDALNVYFQADEDDSTAEDDSATEDGQRRLEGDRWVESDAGPAEEVRQLRAGATAVLDDWTLSIETDSQRTEIDTDVRYVAVAPS
ncbi:hypothetical protein ACFO4E_04445 [Nocardiopsis mangrovi]|uniref:WD40 repeat domain-containing protein n=1 Tax=Nocardiopsis mangrovi TaxID=1179818 RepID=A0ABV9DRL5_9ACTN